MRVVVDANILAAALIHPAGWTARQLARPGVSWFAPGSVIEEIEDHLDSYAEKMGATRTEARRRLRTLLRRIDVVAAEDLREVVQHPLVQDVIQVDPDDAPYAAAAVAADADYLWTRDGDLLALLPGFAVRVLPD